VLTVTVAVQNEMARRAIIDCFLLEAVAGIALAVFPEHPATETLPSGLAVGGALDYLIGTTARLLFRSRLR
jgi:hypothetical protein